MPTTSAMAPQRSDALLDHPTRSGVFTPGIESIIARDELDGHAEYRRHRAESARLGIGGAGATLDRARCLVQRNNEPTLERPLHPVRDSKYGLAAAERAFRVCQARYRP